MCSPPGPEHFAITNNPPAFRSVLKSVPHAATAYYTQHGHEINQSQLMSL